MASFSFVRIARVYKKKYRALLSRSPRPLEKKKSGEEAGENQRERNRKAQLKKD